jgi:hypothetical protein
VAAVTCPASSSASGSVYQAGAEQSGDPRRRRGPGRFPVGRWTWVADDWFRTGVGRTSAGITAWTRWGVATCWDGTPRHVEAERDGLEGD